MRSFNSSGLRGAAKEAQKNSKRLKQTFKKKRICDECGIYYADPPSNICTGCEAYKDHTII